MKFKFIKNEDEAFPDLEEVLLIHDNNLETTEEFDELLEEHHIYQLSDGVYEFYDYKDIIIKKLEKLGWTND